MRPAAKKGHFMMLAFAQLVLLIRVTLFYPSLPLKPELERRKLLNKFWLEKRHQTQAFPLMVKLLSLSVLLSSFDFVCFIQHHTSFVLGSAVAETSDTSMSHFPKECKK